MNSVGEVDKLFLHQNVTRICLQTLQNTLGVITIEDSALMKYYVREVFVKIKNFQVLNVLVKYRIENDTV